MSLLAQYSAPNAPLVNLADGTATVAFSVFLRDLWMRVGGAAAPNNNDLSVTEYADAGIESMQAELYHLRDELESTLTQVAELRAMVASLQGALEAPAFNPAPLVARIESLEQGVVL